MNWLQIWRITFLTLYLLLVGCAAHNAKRPDWSLDVPTETNEGLVIVGVGYPADTERDARDSALQAGFAEFLRFTGVEVSSYAKMVAREQASGNAPGSVSMENVDDTTLASRGFVQKARQLAWHLGKDNNGRTVAYVRLLIPASEVARVTAEQRRDQISRTRPYQQAVADFKSAIASHRLAEAAQLVDPIIELAQKAGRPVPLRTELAGLITRGLELRACGKAEFDLDTDEQASIEICTTHLGAPVADLQVTVMVPSGVDARGSTGPDGRARVGLPSPAYPGIYPLTLKAEVAGGVEKTAPASYAVHGNKTRLAKGRFHDFIEVEAHATSPERVTTRARAEQLALQTARQLAYARLLEMKSGRSLAEHTEVIDGDLARNRVTSEATGQLQAQIVKEDVRWDNGRAHASVVCKTTL